MVKNIRLVAVLVGLGVVGLVTLSAGQKLKSPDLLTAKQVKQLVANAVTPADHLKLSKHFLALAAKYEDDADEHAALADVYRKSPKRPRVEAAFGPDTAGHCDLFAQAARRAAKAALALSEDHERLAAGK